MNLPEACERHLEPFASHLCKELEMCIQLSSDLEGLGWDNESQLLVAKTFAAFFSQLAQIRPLLMIEANKLEQAAALDRA